MNQSKTRRSNSNSKPFAIDLFSGVGGLSLGLKMAGIQVGVDVEIEETAGRYAQYNFPSTNVLFGETAGDVYNFNPQRLQSLGLRKQDVLLVAGGPPCQGFSLAGKRRQDDPLNHLVAEFARVVLDFMPPVFLMENVPGLKTSDSPMLGRALKQLEKRYQVIGPETLKAWHFGVPQMRQRVFILGIEKGLGITPTLPSPTHYRPTEGANLFLHRTPTSWEAISDIPEVDLFEELISGDRVAYDRAPESLFQEWMRGTRELNSFTSIQPQWDHRICTNLRRTQHGPDLTARLSKLGFGQADPVCGIRRLDPSDISTTIRAGTTKDRGSWSAPRPLHPYQNRVLTTRECARIQTFPDWFLFHPVKWHGNRMVGNAVPPFLGKAIGEHILELLGLKPDSVEDVLPRDSSLIEADIKAAAESGYERRKVSQKVVSWSTKKQLLDV
ncbi:MAG: DNA cytosine methyltransferase [Flavobacteriales bacterium]|nr:MAG: DNA cytosine methyltransferase [Flavobacteriales bacterium]